MNRAALQIQVTLDFFRKNVVSRRKMGESLSLKICNAVLEHYSKLGPRGKPRRPAEWTHMAAICSVQNEERVSVLSLATGTKCLGFSEVSYEGYSVNDSHAEVLCRRAFVRFLFLELEKVFRKESSDYFQMSVNFKNRAVLKPELKFHLFLTHTPCGDASIFAKEDEGPDCEKHESEVKRPKIELGDKGSVAKRPKIELDIHRTGAKCVPSGPQDTRLPGADYHSLGAFRTKPGRGERSLSMSCSDKMSKWMVMGIQGCLASLFVEPLYLSSIIVGSCPFSKEAFERAIIQRNKNKLETRHVTICQVPLLFSDSRLSTNDQKPSPVSIVWYRNLDKVETLVDGYKQGSSKIRQKSGEARSLISRRNLFKDFLRLNNLASETAGNSKNLNYSECKLFSTEYSEKWLNLRRFYEHWVADEKKLNAQKFYN